MASRRTLRVAQPGETPPSGPPVTVSEAAASGSTRDLLVAMRSRIADAVGNANTPARDLAALSKRLMEVVRDIEAIDAREKQERESAPVADEAFDAAII